MEKMILIELTNQDAMGLLRELELLQLIRVVPTSSPSPPVSKKLPSKKYRGIISKQDGKQLAEHVYQMRSRWNNI